ncbi:single-stranded-DNA-specific exonuclease RecJ [Acetivibrio cellulolyticus]|uniref:single-stranded-DNA-specific exonuclease RecJ n=1 Tax=Acetivibrio cellulolyticus TaxID=35830 RepID=UPI0001E2BDBD|nr:single-stranded-DNA-specific exonuclease RecJ [Acetivibrio cellulolyticus]
MKVKLNILNGDVQIPKEIIEATDGDELVARIFYNRGYKNPLTIRQMLKDEFYTPTDVNEFTNIKKAVDRILNAADRDEKICVYGDYDVDGVTSTVTLVECLSLFIDKVVYHVPDRFTEGYGMNIEVIEKLAGEGVSLVITCDCGISNINEIKRAKELGMDVILTDHHNIPSELPNADVILNPKLLEEGHKARNLSGCAMAFFLCLALLKHKGMEEKAEDYLDMLALSLIADVVSLNGENRYLLKKALPKLFNTKREGLIKLLGIASKTSELSTEENIAFQIAPRINAAGRMESARLPVELLLCKDPYMADEMAQKIDFLNTERKRVQQEIIDQAIEQVETKKKNKTVLVLYNDFWHHGIIGIAAGRICELYRKPAILLSLKEDGKTVVGSARSVDDINIYELIKECSERLLKFGGHSQAAGLSLLKDDLQGFVGEIELLAEKKHFINETIKVDIDMELEVDNVTDELYDRLQLAGPYGEGFEAPMFVSYGLKVLSDRKTEKNHHIMVLEGKNNTRISAVKWFGSGKSLQGKVFDLTYKISKNTYKGNSSIQLTLGHTVESEGEVQKVFNGSIIDERGSDINLLADKYAQPLFFYEGLNSTCPVASAVDRFGIRKTDNVVFLSPPANTSIFREIIALSNPQNIIINFNVLQDYSFKGFVINLLGLIKHIVSQDKGRGYIEAISIKLGVEEAVVKSGLRFLKAAGKVNYLLSEDDRRVFILKGDGSQTIDMVSAEKRLRNALMEKMAYQQFILKTEVDNFREYLK